MCVVLGWGQWDAFEKTTHSKLTSALTKHLRKHGGAAAAISEIRTVMLRQLSGVGDDDIESEEDEEAKDEEVKPPVVSVVSAGALFNERMVLNQAPPLVLDQAPLPQPRRSPPFQQTQSTTPAGFFVVFNVRLSSGRFCFCVCVGNISVAGQSKTGHMEMIHDISLDDNPRSAPPVAYFLLSGSHIMELCAVGTRGLALSLSGTVRVVDRGQSSP